MAEAHYSRLANDYDSNWAYSPSFIAAMSAAIAAAARIGADDTVVDLGGGTGLYSREIAKSRALRHPVYCVDPSQAMLDQVPPDAGVLPIRASAEQLTSGSVRAVPGEVDVIVIKEAVHHFDDPARTVKGLAGRLRPGGRLLIVMLPIAISYPLFADALTRFSALQPDPHDIEQDIRATGMTTTRSIFEYPLTFEQPRYLDMVRGRYMSLLSTFSDAEIEAGIAEIQQRYPGPEVSFVDRFEFILGVNDL